MIYYIIVLIGVFACSASQLLLKKSASEQHKSKIRELLNWRVITSYGIMLVVLVTNVYAMSRGVQLKDMPILEAMGYVFVPLLSFFFLQEKISKETITAITLIIIGVFFFYL